MAFVVVQKTGFVNYYLTESRNFAASSFLAKKWPTQAAAEAFVKKLKQDHQWARDAIIPLEIREVRTP